MTSSLFSLRSLSYLAYAVILTAVFLYVRFPAEKFKAYCERNIEQLLPGSTCNIEKISFRFPLAAAFQQIRIARDIDGQAVETIIDRLVAIPEPLRFWRAFSLQGSMYSGRFEAKFDADRKNDTFQLAEIHLEGFEAGELATSVGIPDKISGTFAFSGEYQASNSAPADGTGQGVVQVSDGSLLLLQPILALPSIDFEKITANVSRQDGIIAFAEGELLGNEISADFTGELRLASPWSSSSILLSGHLQPDEAYLSNNPKEQQLVQRLLQRYKVTVLPFKVGGTVKRPLFRFSK